MCCGQLPNRQRIGSEQKVTAPRQQRQQVQQPVLPLTNPLMERHRQIHEDLARTRYHQNRFGH